MAKEKEHSEYFSMLDNMTTKEIVFKCGKLHLSIEKTIILIAKYLSKQEKEKLYIDIETPGTNPYEWYQEGWANGELELNNSLVSNIDEPKAKDAYKSLSSERRREAVNAIILKNFGL